MLQGISKWQKPFYTYYGHIYNQAGKHLKWFTFFQYNIGFILMNQLHKYNT